VSNYCDKGHWEAGMTLPCKQCEISSLREQLALAFEAGRMAEREECAKVLEKNGWLLQAADAIRARSTKAP
jgi:hypothetical protein